MAHIEPSILVNRGEVCPHGVDSLSCPRCLDCYQVIVQLRAEIAALEHDLKEAKQEITMLLEAVDSANADRQFYQRRLDELKKVLEGT